MGRERPRRGNELLLVLALLIALAPLGCAVGRTGGKMADASGDQAEIHLALSRKHLADRNYAQALAESQKVLSLAGRNVPVAESLFTIGLIQAHPANPGRDDAKAIATLQRLIKDYPSSPEAGQARVVVQLVRENDKLSRLAERAEGKVEKLNAIIDELKKVDIGVEQMKRDKGR